MSVTKQLLDVFLVDKQLRGLRSRLEAAERFLSTQSTLLADMERQKGILDASLKQLRATIANEEGEGKRLDARMEALREQMNSAKTAKEYNAFLTELNTYKEQRTAAEERALEAMGKAEEADKKVSDINSQFGERQKIVESAKTDRDTKAAEIKDRVAELAAQRAELVKTVPPREMQMLETLIKSRGDEAMSPIEVLDRRAHEGNCSACMMAIPVEAVSALMTGRLVNCPSCRCILFMEEQIFAAEAKKKPAPKKGKAKPSEEEVAKT